jgi:uncharacterized protein
MAATVVILTKIPGRMPVKTRLWSVLGEAGATELYVRMVQQTVELARRFDSTPTLAYSPPDADPLAVFQGITPCRLLPLTAKGGPACLEEALDAAWCGKPMVALGGDAPDLPAALLEDSLALLDSHDAVLVPTPDGGFSCLVLARPVPGLARSFEFGGADTRQRLQGFLMGRGVRLAEVSPWPDVDTPEDLAAWDRRRRTQRD